MTDKKNMVTLFLIEDDDVEAIMIEREFSKQRIANPIIRACDGMEALEMLRNDEVSSPYVILLDLSMPRMNGLEFLEEIRSDPDLSDSVIFVLTTSKDEEDITASYQKHIAGYFVKESSGQAFIDVIHLLNGYWKIAYLPDVSP